MGANALGKTTMMKMIAGVQKPDVGSVDKKIKIEFRRMRKNVTSSKGFRLSVSAADVIKESDGTYTFVGPLFKGFNKGIASYLITRVWKECDEICNWVTIFGVYRGWQASYHNIAIHHLEFRQP